MQINCNVRLPLPIILALSAALVLGACAKPPVEDMDNAAAAVARAESDNDAATYAANTIARARDALSTMRAEAEAKRYDEAKRLAAETIVLAERAIQDGRNAVSRVREEAAQAITIMDNAINETNSAIEGARTAKQKGINFQEIDREFMDTKAEGDRARNANNEKRYREAVDGSSNVRSRLSNITARIGEVAIETSRKK